MKKKLLLLLSLAMVMSTAVAGATACKTRAENSSSSVSSLDSSSQESSSTSQEESTSSSSVEQSSTSSEQDTSSGSDTSSQVKEYAVIYNGGDALGEVPATENYVIGATVTVQASALTKEGFIFVGWKYNETIYYAGDELIMPSEQVEFVAQWEIKPAFSRTEYEYDLLGGQNLELPLTLGNATIYYVEIDNVSLTSDKYSYDKDKSVLVIDKTTIIFLTKGEHTIKVITDKQVEDLSCALTISQSLVTTFDEQTTKNFVYSIDSGVTFNVGYNTTTPIALYQGETQLDEKYYTYDDSTFTIKSEWLEYFCSPTEYKLILSNNDVYSFVVNTNMLFATDYDVVTMHDTLVSTIGHNPLYQYSPNVSIVDNVSGMSGKVLKITPNTQEVTYDCNGYITLRAPIWESTWKKVDIKQDKFYRVSFDYMTENTSDGEFSIKSVSSSWSKVLKLGSENDGVKNSCAYYLSAEEFGNGIYIWAKFIGGGGNVYIDNYKLAEVDSKPQPTSTLTTNTANYSFNNKQEVVFNGHFQQGVTLVAIYQKPKTYDNGYSGGWNFSHNNTTKNYASLATLINGLNGAGTLTIKTQLLDTLWGDTEFVAEFSDGSEVSFTISSDVDTYTDYDNTTLYGYLNGNKNSGSPLNSGLWGNSVADIENKGDGNKALFIRSTEGAADTCAFTIRMHTHPWDWYNVYGVAGNQYRVTFKYKISNLAQDSVYFYVMALGTEQDIRANFYGNYSQLDWVAGDNYYKVRYNLIADGNEHTFDSGYFTFDANLRMMKIQLPVFTAGDNAYFMVDEYRVSHTTGVEYILNSVTDYEIGSTQSLAFSLGGQTLTSVKVDLADLPYVLDGQNVTLDKATLDSLSGGTHTLTVVTDKGTFVKEITISVPKKSILTETTKKVVSGSGKVTLAGEFDDGLEITSFTRQGTDIWDSSTASPVNMNFSYITITQTGLQLDAELINQVYGTNKYVVGFSNGKTVEFSLTSNVKFYSNYDETYVFATLQGNNAACQDSLMWEVVNVEGNNKIKYTPSNATQGHAVAAINGSGTDNMIFTFGNAAICPYVFWNFNFDSGDTAVISFDYQAVVGTKNSLYQFIWVDKSMVVHTVALNGKDTFSIELDVANLSYFAINCPASSPDLVAETYLYIDNMSIGVKDSTYLSEHAKAVVYGGEQVTLAGAFEETLTVTSLKRFGNNFWDDTKLVAGELDTSLITLSTSGLVVSQELINKVYSTEIFWATLSNGDVVKFSLTSNLLFFSNFDDTNVVELSEGNVRSCQDTAMRSFAEDNGNRYMVYTPANAVLGHASGANNGSGADNRICTYSNNALNHWWWEYDFESGSTLIVFFDYQLSLGSQPNNYVFHWFDASGTMQTVALDSQETSFYIELQVDNLAAFGIGCPSATGENVGTSMIIDNFGFGKKV